MKRQCPVCKRDYTVDIKLTPVTDAGVELTDKRFYLDYDLAPEGLRWEFSRVFVTGADYVYFNGATCRMGGSYELLVCSAMCSMTAMGVLEKAGRE